MKMKIESRKVLTVFVFLTCVCFSFATLASAEEPSATVTIESTSVAIGVGVEWGHGTLKFQGKEYKFSVNGLSVIDLGVASISATGNVYKLKKLSDFSGTYTAAGAGIAIGGGAGASTMVNQNDVVMNLTSTKAGVKFKLAPEGLKIELK
ncbi:MAG: hypothetical protein JJV98_08975 [Desulfosarcina sp.]|nr:hypothetical protein [Desulfobacterales bacterium]